MVSLVTLFAPNHTLQAGFSPTTVIAWFPGHISYAIDIMDVGSGSGPDIINTAASMEVRKTPTRFTISEFLIILNVQRVRLHLDMFISLNYLKSFMIIR